MHRIPQVLALLAAVLCASCASTSGRAADQTTSAALEEREPVLRFDIVEVPGRGKVGRVSGDVQRLSRAENQWVDVMEGYRLSHKDQFKIGSGASLNVVFSASERAEFLAAPKDRWIQFELRGSGNK